MEDFSKRNKKKTILLLLLLLTLKTVVLLNIFVETMIFFPLRILWWIESLKRLNLFEIEIFFKIINAFIVTFDKFNASFAELKY